MNITIHRVIILVISPSESFIRKHRFKLIKILTGLLNPRNSFVHWHKAFSSNTLTKNGVKQLGHTFCRLEILWRIIGISVRSLWYTVIRGSPTRRSFTIYGKKHSSWLPMYSNWTPNSYISHICHDNHNDRELFSTIRKPVNRHSLLFQVPTKKSYNLSSALNEISMRYFLISLILKFST